MIEEKALQLDIHTHTLASGHAYGTIREMAAAAAERDLRLLGLSEHGPGIAGVCDPIYFLNLEVVPRRLYGVEILHGCEVNVLTDGSLSLEPRYLDRLDYAIAGIHAHCHPNAGAEKNTDDLISCMRDRHVFFVSHPDDSTMPLQYGRLVEAAREFHVALEVNNSSLAYPNNRPGCRENYRVMLPLCRRLGVPVIVSSDAHDPSAVGNFEEARALLNEIGFDERLILNTDVAKFKEFIGYRG